MYSVLDKYLERLFLIIENLKKHRGFLCEVYGNIYWFNVAYNLILAKISNKYLPLFGDFSYLAIFNHTILIRR